jgi:hypothetical protein
MRLYCFSPFIRAINFLRARFFASPSPAIQMTDDHELSEYIEQWSILKKYIILTGYLGVTGTEGDPPPIT